MISATLRTADAAKAFPAVEHSRLITFDMDKSDKRSGICLLALALSFSHAAEAINYMAANKVQEKQCNSRKELSSIGNSQAKVQQHERRMPATPAGTKD